MTKLYCKRCEKEIDRIVWRYTEPVDDFAKWDEGTGRYEYEDSVDKGDLGCVTLCYYCEAQLKNFGYITDYDQAIREKE